jgi:Integrase core domain
MDILSVNVDLPSGTTDPHAFMVCSIVNLPRRPLTGSGSLTSPTSRPARDGSICPPSWTSTAGIVGWPMRDHMRTELPLAALQMAISAQRPGAGLMHHSDRGVQYASHDYRTALATNGITAS